MSVGGNQIHWLESGRGPLMGRLDRKAYDPLAW